MGGRQLSFTARYVLLFGLLLLMANLILGIVTLEQSKTAMKDLIEKDMLDIVNSAAGLLDGDVLGALTEDDVDGPIFEDIKRKLLVFQNSTDIEFIYAVRHTDDDRYVFTVDPDPVDPGAFGEEILTTPALIEAAKGIPTVDSSPAEDRWGDFYSAYSPVFDSHDEIAGVVGVDFDTQWYERQVTKNTLSIAVVTFLSVTLAGVVVVLMTNRVRMKFRELGEGLSNLSKNVDVLMGEMVTYTGFEMPAIASTMAATENDADELKVLGAKIETMQNDMRVYLDFLRSQAYTDALTKVKNSAAYHETVDGLEKKVAGGAADFCVGVFDINGLKELNDTHGHECGDYYIQGAAKALVQGFGDDNVYRIGGDEFAVVMEGVDQECVDRCLRAVADAVNAFNTSSRYPAALAISRGTAYFSKDEDSSYREVFVRADHAMYEDKSAYYRSTASHDRRRR